MTTITAIAPAKAILLGEHAVNRGQAALAVSIGLHARCVVSPRASGGITLTGGGHSATTSVAAIRDLGRMIDTWRATQDFAAIQGLAAADFFAPTKYVLASADSWLPEHIDITFHSEIPPAVGLGSGGASFVALAAALLTLHGDALAPRQVARWAHRGDIVAHGGVASGLDTQTSLYGGAIRYTAAAEGAPIADAPGLTLVIGNTGVFAATSDVNGRVRMWLAERPARQHYFDAIGLLSRHAEPALIHGDWPELGRLMNLNQLVLERIGVSCAALEQLNDAALGAGALGAKLAGSGGGGIMIALATPATVEPIAAAIAQAGGTPIVAPVGVPGVQVLTHEAEGTH